MTHLVTTGGRHSRRVAAREARDRERRVRCKGIVLDLVHTGGKAFVRQLGDQTRPAPISDRNCCFSDACECVLIAGAFCPVNPAHTKRVRKSEGKRRSLVSVDPLHQSKSYTSSKSCVAVASWPHTTTMCCLIRTSCVPVTRIQNLSPSVGVFIL